MDRIHATSKNVWKTQLCQFGLTFQPDVESFSDRKGEAGKIVCGTDPKAVDSPALKSLTSPYVYQLMKEKISASCDWLLLVT